MRGRGLMKQRWVWHSRMLLYKYIVTGIATRGVRPTGDRTHRRTYLLRMNHCVVWYRMWWVWLMMGRIVDHFLWRHCWLIRGGMVVNVHVRVRGTTRLMNYNNKNRNNSKRSSLQIQWNPSITDTIGLVFVIDSTLVM